MSLPKRISWIRVIAMVSCLFAAGIYLTFAPTTSRADPGDCCVCSYGGGEYSNGACRSGNECRCMYQNGQCVGCEWVNNSANCRGVVAFEEGNY